MAGVTDKPFRQLCKRLGAGLAVSEMTISDPRFWKTDKSLRRMDHEGEPAPVSVQIAGTEPAAAFAMLPAFVPGDLVKVVVTALLAAGLWKAYPRAFR